MVLVKKKNGTLRISIDYWDLNQKAINNWYPIPQIHELMDELHGEKFFSKIDLLSGYHQIKMREENIQKKDFCFHFGHFVVLVIPFGLTNAPTTFQYCMNKVFSEKIRKYVLDFFYDILFILEHWRSTYSIRCSVNYSCRSILLC